MILSIFFQKHEDTLLKWMKILKLRNRPTIDSKLCEEHFDMSDLYRTPKGYFKVNTMNYVCVSFVQLPFDVKM